MRNNASSGTARNLASLTACALLTVFVTAIAGPLHADVTPRDGFLAIQRQVESIEPKLVKSTVVIKLYDGSGSGVIISPDGYVLTAGHVVEGQEGHRVRVVLADGRTLPASIVAANRDTDLGIVKIQDVEGLPSVQLGDSSTLRRGEWVLATGHPLGLHAGRPPVLRIGRVIRAMNGRFGRGMPSISTDAPIISGDSGGPLFDLNGRVVGINSMITTGDQRMFSLHVPVNLAKAAIIRTLHGQMPDSWDGPPAPFESDMRSSVDALNAGDASSAARLAKEAADIDQASAAARILLARAYVKSGQPQLALAAISQACDRGFNDVELLRRDADFAPLKSQPVMAKILDRLDAFYGLPGLRKGDADLLSSAIPARTVGSVVRIQSGGNDVALGTVMSADGDILTKASELPEGNLACAIDGRQTVPVMRAGVDTLWDIALLKVNATGLKPLPVSENAVVGEWTFSPDASGAVAAVGIVGVSDMPVHGKGIASPPTSKAYMGVRMEPVSPEDLRSAGLRHGVRVLVQPNFPAARAGVQSGDIIFDVEGQAVSDPDGMMDAMVKKSPGDTVTLKLVRGAEHMIITVPLTARPADAGVRMGMPEFLSGEVSRMQGPFDRVLHHDSVLKPNAMGGPLLDMDGHVIGLNIARADRTSTYAIPVHDLQEIYGRLKAAR